MTIQNRRPPAFAQGFNKIAARLAGHRLVPLWALVQHRGRKSGRAYRTPIAIVGSTPSSVYIGLPWGRHTDWIRNLQAGGGTLVWKGQTFAVAEPAFAGKDEVLASTSGLRRELARRWPLQDYLRLTVQPAGH
ncbi:nitroreductase family deazaflavin-dependent oxidoreductase [Amycolatopsis thermophila]|uniref:Deazaflavin-dependent oxidoreductase (Nitroreductase family) n=1 Tax=Amycolatopsis thermophila TaxID=206084 RepID=A0ABU0F6F2_9PSEU|nr:nitroreductase family deazaflavin-dependent oxidoreductase [Amycolatopsis thermophila]MDQ0382615.1 deazaflavin-dependent oxidoreductase (nitroreductase family) [Amycolatopsis thermophila]